MGLNDFKIIEPDDHFVLEHKKSPEYQVITIQVDNVKVALTIYAPVI